MATATVTLELTPNELQIVRAALKMYARVNTNLLLSSNKLLDSYTHDLSIHDGKPDKAVRDTHRLIRAIGLR